MFARISSKLLNVNQIILQGAVVFLLIEFLDELHYGAEGAALPALRSDLGLSYDQVGLLLGLPNMIGALVEPGLMLLGDTRLRKSLVVGGGLVVGISLLIIAGSHSFPALLLAFILSFPASGAFVSLSQATLMDLNHGRESHWMARWTAIGSLGNLAAPLILAGGFALGWGWRWAYVALAGLALILALLALRQPFPSDTQPVEAHSAPQIGANTARNLLNNLWTAARNLHLWRWIGLLVLADLLLDVFTSYAALYFTDVMGASQSQAGLWLGVLMISGLAADLALIPLLERIPGRRLVWITAAAALIVYPAWLLIPWPAAKVAGLVLIRFTTLGWYPVLQGEAYAAAPGQSGTVMALNSVAGLAAGGLTWAVGWTAGHAGLEAAMWLLLAAPISLLIFTPKD